LSLEHFRFRFGGRSRLASVACLPIHVCRSFYLWWFPLGRHSELGGSLCPSKVQCDANRFPKTWLYRNIKQKMYMNVSVQNQKIAFKWANFVIQEILVTLNLELCKLARTAECGPSICRCVPAAVLLERPRQANRAVKTFSWFCSLANSENLTLIFFHLKIYEGDAFSTFFGHFEATKSAQLSLLFSAINLYSFNYPSLCFDITIWNPPWDMSESGKKVANPSFSHRFIRP
jgi:hypothetical protein